MPAQTLDEPAIVPGCAGNGSTVMIKVRGVLLPQLLLAVTLKVPLLPGVRLTLVPLPLGAPLPL
jgi:hypothetical protein